MPGLSRSELFDVVLGVTIDATHNLVLAAETGQTVETHITSTSSLAGVWEGTFEFLGHGGVTEASADWFPLPCTITNTSTLTPNLPGATITPTDDDLLLTATLGARYVRFRRTAGSGTANRGLSNDSVQEILSASGLGDVVALASEKTDDAAFTPGTSKVVMAGFEADDTSTDSVDEGDAGAARMSLDRLQRVLQGNKSVPFSIICDGTDELLISASAKRLVFLDVFHIDATPVYVKVYDKATAASESDTPIHRMGVPANATAALGAGSNKNYPAQIDLTNGLSIRAVVGLTDSDDTALTNNEVLINGAYTL